MKPKNYWTYEKCKEAALKCETKKELREKYGTVHKLIYKNKWVELVEHFSEFRKANGYCTYEKCKDVAFKFTNKTIFIKEYYSAYMSITKNNWNELFDHMLKYEKSYDTYTYVDCKEIVSKCKHKSEFISSNYRHYNTIIKNDWNELMLNFSDKEYLTYDKCRELALLCETKK